MRKLLILLLSALSLTTLAQEKQVAILESIAMTKEVSTMHRSMVRGEMVKAIGRQSGYAAFTRTDIDQIMSEHNFQQSGMVDDVTRKRIGAMQGVDYVCVTKITKEGNNYYLEANLVNIETGKISNPATQYGELEGESLSNMLAACEKLATELVGKKVQTTTTISTAPANIDAQTDNPSSPKLTAKQKQQSPDYLDIDMTDELFAVSEYAQDIVNKPFVFTCTHNLAREDVIAIIKRCIDEEFVAYEVNDSNAGWYRTIWNTEQFSGNKYVRTRLEIKEKNDTDGKLKFNFILQSHIMIEGDTTNKEYQEWDRALKKYIRLAMELRYRIEQ